jgi:hypothetical protein
VLAACACLQNVSSHFTETRSKMKILNKILSIILIFLTQISCGQTEIKTKGENIQKKYDQVISDPKNKLTDKIENLEIEYVVFGCACPNWIRTQDNYNSDTTKNFKELYFYIEPAEKSIELPIYFDAFRHQLKITGQFYENEDYPQGTIEMEEKMPKAKVFRYSKIEIINKPNFDPETKIETLTLQYNAISCTCAKWSETKIKNKTDKKSNYWLEPANEKLIQADTIFDGENLPIEIKVTGQIVSENGFPKQKSLTKVGQEEAGKVFRYIKIEIIKNGQKKNGY